MLRSAFRYWFVALALALLLILARFPGDEGTPFFWMFVVGMVVGPFLGALLWRLMVDKPAPRVITHRDGTQARVDGAGKGYERLTATHETPGTGMLDGALEWLGRLF